MCEAEGTWSACTRTHQPSDVSVDHSWLWQLNPHHGSVWHADKFVDCARFRYGGAGPLELIVCAVCHPGSTKALHTLLAAPFENNGLELCR